MSREILTHIRLGHMETVVTFTDVANLVSPIIDETDGTPNYDVLICDAHTAQLEVAVPQNVRRIVVPSGERCKQIDVLHSVIESMVNFGLTRKSTIYALGGGALTDLAAFAASIYLRGISVVLLPTTLLSMVDAAIGGKTGIDFGGFKNMVGTFAPAREVRIAPDVLSTLPQREYMSGLAEALKAGLLGDMELFRAFEENVTEILHRDEAVVRTIISRAVLFKSKIVEADFTEQGQRAFLNLGHTFGHALETALGLGIWTHGEAVAWGIARALRGGVHLGLTDPSYCDRVVTLLDRYGYNTGPAPVDGRLILENMYKDKKRSTRGLAFVLQRGPQQTVLQTLEPKQILDILTL